MESFLTIIFLRFIFLLLLFHLFKEEEIINNPIIISDNPNPLVLTYKEKYIILTSGQTIYVNKETGTIASNYNFCEYSSPYVLGSTESGKNFIYSSQKLCLFTLPDIFQIYIDNLTYSDSSKYIGYIQESKYKGNENKYMYCRCEMKQDEIIIYGKKGNNKVVFTYAYKLKTYQEIEIDCSPNIEDKLACKKLLNNFYSCAITCNGKIFIYILVYRAKKSGTISNCELFQEARVQLSQFVSHTEVEMYKTAIDTTDIICAKEINTKVIECIEVNYKYLETISNSQCFYNSTVSTKFLFSNPLTDDEDENNINCDYKSFGDEYIFCCGGINYIKCKRLDNERNSHYIFNLDLQGKNNNINILTSSSSFVSFFT